MGNSYFDEIIKNNDDLKTLSDDIGIKFISEDLEHKLDETQKHYDQVVYNYQNPSDEFYLTVRSMFETGYFSFKKPLKIKSNRQVAPINRGTGGSIPFQIILSARSRFSDGSNIYTLESSFDSGIVPVPGDLLVSTSTMELTQRQDHIIENQSTTVSGTKYFKIDTGFTYKELSGIIVEVKRGNSYELLEYSQLFVSVSSDYSYELTQEGKIIVTVLISNKEGKDIKAGESIKVTAMVSEDNPTIPDTLFYLDNAIDYLFSIDLSEIEVSTRYAPYPSVSELQDQLRYGKLNTSDIILNEDFYQLLVNKVGGFESLKVWQEKEEQAETGVYDQTNLNKIFVSYIIEGYQSGLTGSDKTAQDDEITQKDKEIKDTIASALYARPVEIVVNSIIDITKISISITFIGKSLIISENLKDEIKDSLSGYYDDEKKPLNPGIVTATIYGVVNKYYEKFYVGVIITGDKAGGLKNKEFYSVPLANIEVS